MELSSRGCGECDLIRNRCECGHIHHHRSSTSPILSKNSLSSLDSRDSRLPARGDLVDHASCIIIVPSHPN